MPITKTRTRFQKLDLPGGGIAYVPDDITILFPEAPDIAVEDRHYLAYIPWDDRYLKHIPRKYRDFFVYALPYLHARTSDVHTALSVSQLPKLFAATNRSALRSTRPTATSSRPSRLRPLLIFPS